MIANRRYSTFLLDLDHTLFDSDASEKAAFAQAMAVAGINAADNHMDSYRRINKALWAAVERGETTPQEVRELRFRQLIKELNLEADASRMSDAFVSGLADNGELYDGVLDVLQQLQSKVTMALVTNGLSEVQRARVGRLEIEEFFSAIVISAEVGVAKPGTEIYDIVFNELGTPDKDSALMVGDSLSSDIRGGSNYGIATCWYNPQGKSAGADDHVVHDISDLRELLPLSCGH